MNIFASYPCPERSAFVLDDQRLVKMTLESCQMLSMVAAHVGLWQPGYCRPTHHQHPCVIWVAESRDNWDWLWDHVWALDLERRRRWSRTAVHKTLAACHARHLQQTRKWLPALGSTPHPNCARNKLLGIDYTHIPDTHLAYRLYLSARWRRQRKPAMCTIVGMYDDRNWRSE